MTVLVVSPRVHAARGAELEALAREARHPLELLVLPDDPEGRLSASDCARIDLAFFSGDLFPGSSRQFFSTVRKAPNLKWLQVANAGVDHPIYTEMQQRGARLTTAVGANAEPIAHTAIAGMLMLGRNFPHWLSGQQRKSWEPIRGAAAPRDMRGQHVVIVGFGHIGKYIARLALALGMTVTGVRRSPRQPDDPADRICPPGELRALLPQTDWLVLACPLTPETRNLVDADALATLPRGARLINIARGEVVDEPALIAALQSGHLGGAYLDVFVQEPLPAESPLWDMENVIVTPHNSATSSGNEDRVYAIFRDNLARWFRGKALVNEVPKP